MFVLRKMPYLHKFFLQQSKNQEEPPQQFFMITTFVDMTKCSKNHSRATNSWQSGIYSKTKKILITLPVMTDSLSILYWWRKIDGELLFPQIVPCILGGLYWVLLPMVSFIKLFNSGLYSVRIHLSFLHNFVL